MAFLPLIPQSTDLLSISQGNILNNFTILGAIAGNGNASSASLNSSSGFNWVYLPPQGATPPAGASFTSGNVGIYSATNSSTSYNELYVNKQTNFGSGTVTAQIPFTAGSIGANPGWSYLPSGLIIQFGALPSTTSGGSNTVNFPLAFPTGAYSGYLTVGSGTSAVVANVTSLSSTQIVFYTSANVKIYWFAIGR
jgi:hypothetical protein